MTLLSVIVPVYNEAENLPLFFDAIIPVLSSLTADWEIICVDDGSVDSSVSVVKSQHHKDARVKLISLSRNFGKEAALTAGLFNASGDAVIPIDADLQDPPELIPDMVIKWREGYKVVLATRRFRRGDSWFKKYSALSFYWLIGVLSHNHIPKNSGDFRLMDREAVEALKHLPERTRFMKGLLSWVGYPTTQVYYDRADRAVGKSRFNFFSLWRLALDGVFSFSTAPLKIWTYAGTIITMASFSYAIYLIIRALGGRQDVPGYASLMVTILFLGGIQLISLGILGEYIGRIYRETKHRPLYLIKDTAGIEKKTPLV